MVRVIILPKRGNPEQRTRADYEALKRRLAAQKAIWAQADREREVRRG